MDAEELEEARYAHIDINVVPTSWAPWRRRDAEGKGEAPSHVRVSLVGGRIVFRFDQRKKPSGVLPSVLSVASSPASQPSPLPPSKSLCARHPQAPLGPPSTGTHPAPPTVIRFSTGHGSPHKPSSTHTLPSPTIVS